MNETLQLIVGAVDKSSATIKGISNNLDNLKSAGEKLQSALNFAVIGFGFSKMLQIAEESNTAMRGLQTSVEGVGGNFAEVKKEAEKIADSKWGSIFGDDEIYSALDKLTQKLGDPKKALDALVPTLDIASAGQLDLETAVSLTAKGMEGQITALQRSFPWIKTWQESGKTSAEIMQELQKRTAGATEKMSETQGLKRLKVVLEEVAETVGKLLMPIIDGFVFVLEKLGTKTLVTIGVIAGLIALVIKLPAMLSAVRIAVLALNTAMSANPFGVIVTGIGLLIGAIVILYQKFIGFRVVVDMIGAKLLWFGSMVLVPIAMVIKSLAVSLGAFLYALSNPMDISAWKRASETIKGTWLNSMNTVLETASKTGTLAGKSYAERYQEELDKMNADKQKAPDSNALSKNTQKDKTKTTEQVDNSKAINQEEELRLKYIQDEIDLEEERKKKVAESTKFQMGLLQELSSFQTDNQSKALKDLDTWYVDSLQKAENNSKAVALVEELKTKKLQAIQQEHDSSMLNYQVEYLKLKGQNQQADLLQLQAEKNAELALHESSESDKLAISNLYALKEKEIKDSYDSVLLESQKLMQGAIDASVNALSNAIQSIFDTSQSASSKLHGIWKGLTQSILSMLSQVIAKALVYQALTLALGPAGTFLGMTAGKLLGFQTNSDESKIIPGPIGMPFPIMAHGGEIIGRGNNSNSSGTTVMVQGSIYGWDGAIEQIRNGLNRHQRLTGLTAGVV